MANKAPSHVPAKTAFDFEALEISVSKLLLDPNNYRFLDRKKFKKKAANVGPEHGGRVLGCLFPSGA
jgi:hypothetical protein